MTRLSIGVNCWFKHLSGLVAAVDLPRRTIHLAMMKVKPWPAYPRRCSVLKMTQVAE
jgi:hypothetical protein